MPKLYDVTLRDGNHALRHDLSPDFVASYCREVDGSGVWAVEVGHGNGLGASSHLVGRSAHPDEALISAARSNLKQAKLGVHCIPGFATISRDLIPAVDLGVEVFRVATHVTEATLAQTHIEWLRSQEVEVHGVLMMAHMADVEVLVEQAMTMVNYGASAVVLMDSSGHFTPKDVCTRVQRVIEGTGANVGFHAHNNLGLGVANAIEAITADASIIDGATMGLGAGAGNAQLEAIAAVCQRMGSADSNIAQLLRTSALTEASFRNALPRVSASGIESGLAGVFSGFAPQVKAVSAEFGIDVSTLWQALGERRLVAGQESLIREIAQEVVSAKALTATPQEFKKEE